MRPDSLAFLFSSIQSLPGIGKNHSASLQKLVGPLNIDLLFHLPRTFIQWEHVSSIKNTLHDQHISITLTVRSHQKASPRTPHRVLCLDQDGNHISLVYFQKNSYLEKNLPVGEQKIIQGKIEYYRNQPQITHPQHIFSLNKNNQPPNLIEPLYPLSASLTQFTLRRAIQHILKNLPPCPEWIPQKTLNHQKWPSFNDALQKTHSPSTPQDLEPLSPHRQRLAYDETLAHQISIASTQNDAKIHKKIYTLAPNPSFLKTFSSLIPFSLTSDQNNAILTILNDMSLPSPMQRLLQGDVGSGKTIVAFAAIIAAAQNGFQSVLMAPTETLVHQHAQNLSPLAKHFGFPIYTLTGNHSAKPQKNTLENIQNGNALITIGTHALFQNKSLFKNLNLVVIDEQQRFGVHQRLSLLRKGLNTDMLLLTATPIPRSLMMIHYGNLNASFLKEKPPGRKLINTTVSNIQRLPELEHAIKRHIKKNGLIYWVCPLVDEGQNTELSHVTGRAEQLAQQFGEHNVALIHGKIKGTERQNIIKNFSSAKTPILVASTVIEVGIDVPAADVMIIEHAERFGLSQLHQLRGRVGRGQNDAFCILLYAPPLSHVAQQRLNIIRQSQDGFFIAEKDLELRGAGDVLGTRQSGDLQFHFINTHEHRKILDLVSHDIKQYQISPQNHEHIPHLLSLFQYDKTLNLTKSG